MIRGYATSLWSRATARRLGIEVLLSFGVFGSIYQVGAAAYPDVFTGWAKLVWLASVVVMVAIVRALPRTHFSVSFGHPSTTVVVKVGDLLDEPNHLVIGFSDTFDTELGEVISPDSLQGQFLTRLYRGDQVRLDGDLANALSGIIGTLDETKVRGKKHRFPMGTTVSLSGERRKFVCAAYSKLRSADLVAESDLDTIWLALSCVWTELRTKGEQMPVAIPIVGTFLARVGGASSATLARIILLSFLVHSRMKPITRELTLVIAERDLDKINLLELEDFVRSLNR